MSFTTSAAGIELETFGTLSDVSAQVDNAEELCAAGKPAEAFKLRYDTPYSDYKSRYIVCELVKHAANRLGDYRLAQSAAREADAYLRDFRIYAK